MKKTMKELKNIFPRAVGIFLIFTLLCGVAYTGAVTVLAQVLFPAQANGSVIEVDGKKYGCALLGQRYTDDAHLWGRVMDLDVSTFQGENGEPLLYAAPSNPFSGRRGDRQCAVGQSDDAGRHPISIFRRS